MTRITFAIYKSILAAVIVDMTWTILPREFSFVFVLTISFLGNVLIDRAGIAGVLGTRLSRVGALLLASAVNSQAYEKARFWEFWPAIVVANSICLASAGIYATNAIRLANPGT